MSRRIIATILLVTVFWNGLLAAPVTRAAAITAPGENFTQCAVNGQLVGPFADLVNGKLTSIGTLIKNLATGLAGDLVGSALAGAMQKIGNVVSKIPVIGPFFGALFGGVQPVTDTTVQRLQATLMNFLANMTYKDQAVARCTARQIMNTIISQTLTIARTRGRDGGPTFVTNWNNFQAQAQYRGENIFRAMLSTSKVCPYFGDDLKKAFGLSPNQKISLGAQKTRVDSLTSFASDIGCTMPAGFDPAKFDQDFAGAGGWDAIARLAQPQNNYYGALLLSYNEAAKQRTAAQTADVNQVLANNGYTGISGNGKSDSCLIKGPAGDCLAYKDIKTPGSNISSSVDATNNAEYDWLANVHQVNEIVANATEVMLNRLFNFSSSDEGSYKLSTEAGIRVPGADDTVPIDFGDIPGTGGTPVCSATAPQAGFLNVLYSTYQQLAGYNFSSSAARMQDTGLTGLNPFSNMTDLLSGQKNDSTGTQYSDQINNILRQIDLMLAKYHDITGVFGDPDHILTTQDRDDLNTARNNVLTPLQDLITTVNGTCTTTTTP
ncbi:MAG TPA: hypothetical protein VG941_01715 [Candidatus Paceibacterota bacterium]|nr:hypothetical protein [Candidatus Paceibacterota bacterium]